MFARRTKDKSNTVVQLQSVANTKVVGKVIVVGTGPAGMRFADELLLRQPDTHLQLFGNEPFKPYNRVLLSSLLVFSSAVLVLLLGLVTQAASVMECMCEYGLKLDRVAPFITDPPLTSFT